MDLRVILSTLIYAIVLFAGILNHEIWSDEAQHFLLAAKSSTFWELYENCRYEGHPPLWNILLFIITRFTENPFSMQVLNGCIALLNTFLILRYSPFPFITKLGISFGYFNLFEYGIISRNYALVFLFVLLYCISRTKKPENAGQRIIILLLLSFTHLFGMFAAIVLFISEYNTERKKSFRERVWTVEFWGILAMILITFVFPPKGHMLVDEYNTASFFSIERIRKIASVPIKAFVHIPDFTQDNLWNKDILIMHLPILAGLLSMVLVIVCIFVFKSRVQRFIMIPAIILFMVFVYVSPLKVVTRHCGALMLLFIACCWMESSKTSLRLLNFFLVIQFLGGMIMYYIDLKRPFSNSETVAEYFARERVKGSVIAMSNQGSGSSVSAYLKEDLYYPEKNGYGSFARWNIIPFIIPDDSVFARVRRLDNPVAYVVLNHLPKNVPPDFNYVVSCEDAIVASENYFIYERH